MACVDAATAKASTPTKSLITLSSWQSLGENSCAWVRYVSRGVALSARAGPRCAGFSDAEMSLSVFPPKGRDYRQKYWVQQR
jgi:hypothetical protein